MQVNETLNEGLKRGYAITVTAAELEAKVNEKLAEWFEENPQEARQIVGKIIEAALAREAAKVKSQWRC